MYVFASEAVLILVLFLRVHCLKYLCWTYASMVYVLWTPFRPAFMAMYYVER